MNSDKLLAYVEVINKINNLKKTLNEKATEPIPGVLPAIKAQFISGINSTLDSVIIMVIDLITEESKKKWVPRLLFYLPSLSL